MQACGLAPNLVSYGICMDACAKAGLWEKVSRTHDVLLVLPHILMLLLHETVWGCTRNAPLGMSRFTERKKWCSEVVFLHVTYPDISR